MIPIKTWRERFYGTARLAREEAMQAEIADLHTRIENLAAVAQAAKDLRAAVSYRAACLLAGSPEQTDHATNKMWEAHDKLGDALRKLENQS